MHSLLEEVLREVKGLTLNILAKCDAACTCFSRICKNSHCIDQSGHDHLRSCDPIPVFADWFECIVRTDGKAAALLQLLENRVRLARCKSICREYKKRNIIYSCCCTCCYHVCSSRSDGGSACNDFFAVALFCKSGSNVTHTLLISSLKNLQLSRICIQCLTKSYSNTVSEDREKSFYEFCLHSVHGNILIIQKFYNCLCSCHSYCL